MRKLSELAGRDLRWAKADRGSGGGTLELPDGRRIQADTILTRWTPR